MPPTGQKRNPLHRFSRVLLAAIALWFGVGSAHAESRSHAGLQALYDFREGSGTVLHDRSGSGRALDLLIPDPEAVEWNNKGLTLLQATQIHSSEPALKLNEAIRRSGEITIEAWIEPSNLQQEGPARILTLSRSGTERNMTLGQDGDHYDVRFRTLKTGNNGTPSLTTKNPSVDKHLTHVVYTRNRAGRAQLFLNNEPIVQKQVSGSVSNWNGQFRLALGNEFGASRAWLGTYRMIAIYSRDLLPREIDHHFNLGPDAVTEVAPVGSEFAANEHLFVSKIAPLLAARCFECHDALNQKGDLDLSQRARAMAGGSGGPVIIPGNPSESQLFLSLLANDMPAKRDPLSQTEKAWVRQWIEGGASWPVESIDPAAFAHETGVQALWLRRLTLVEYVHTVEAAVGIDIRAETEALLPADLRADGFSNTAYNLGVDLKHVSAYAQLAEHIVDKMDVMAFVKRFTNSRLLTDNHMRALIQDMGKWLLRGPLEAHEIDLFRGVSTTVAAAGGTFEDAVEFILEGMFQSPRFLYRMENQRGDGNRWHLGEHELAVRMSYMLWGGPPDKALIEAAEAGELFTDDGLDQQIERMLGDPRAVNHSRWFVFEWLNLNRLHHLKPNPDRFPTWNPTLAQAMIDETLDFFEVIVWKAGRPLAELFNAQFTIAAPQLASHYGITPSSDSSTTRYDLSSVAGRGGLLTHGSVLTVGGDEASMVARGLFVLHDLLRGVVNDPPPCVDTTPVPTTAGLTQRAIAEERIANAQCGGCHSRFEPLAFGLERFDGIGAYHIADEFGNKLREDGSILFPGQAEPLAYASSEELMNHLAASNRVKESLAWKLTQFALGRPLSFQDAESVDKIHQNAQKNGGTYQSMMAEIVKSDLVQTTDTEIIE